MSQAESSTRGEKDWAQSSKAAWAADSCSAERGRKISSVQSSAWALVMPGVMPMEEAFG